MTNFQMHLLLANLWLVAGLFHKSPWPLLIAFLNLAIAAALLLSPPKSAGATKEATE